ncbi:hypothetical protein BDW66DRAFT_90613 [Aspergillus desertorum]
MASFMLIEAVAQRNFDRLFTTVSRAAAAATLPLVPCRRLSARGHWRWQRLSARLCDGYSLGRITTVHFQGFLSFIPLLHDIVLCVLPGYPAMDLGSGLYGGWLTGII